MRKFNHKRSLNHIDRTVKETLKECVHETRNDLPMSLKVKHIAEITNTSEKTVYLRLENGEIPGANKIMGHWRVPRDVFLSWWYGDWFKEKM